MVKWKGQKHVLLQCSILDLTHKDTSTKIMKYTRHSCTSPSKNLDITAIGNLFSLTDIQVKKLRETIIKPELDNLTQRHKHKNNEVYQAFLHLPIKKLGYHCNWKSLFTHWHTSKKSWEKPYLNLSLTISHRQSCLWAVEWKVYTQWTKFYFTMQSIKVTF
jgi:hypothetical protein